VKRVLWTPQFRRELVSSLPPRAAALMVRRRTDEYQEKVAASLLRQLEFNRQAAALATAPALGHA
jgi:hypothetical protein